VTSTATPFASAVANVLTGTAMKYVLLGINLALGIYLLPFTIAHLGKEQYGLWMLAASMTGYFQLLDLGYGNGLVRHIAQADARQDEGEINRTLSTFVVVYLALGAVAFAGIVALAAFALPRFPNLSPPQITEARWILIILGLRVAIGFPMTVFGSITTARQRFTLNGAIAIVVALATAAVTIGVLRTGHGIVTLVAATTAVNLLAYVAYARAARIVFPAMRIALPLFTPRLVREVTAFSFYLFVIAVAANVAFNLDNVVVGAVLGTGAVAVYSVAYRLAEYQRMLCGQFNGLLFPVVVRFEAGGDQAALRKTLIEGTRISLALVAGVTACLLTFARPLVNRWIGPGFDGAVAPLGALAAAGIVLVALGPLGNVLLAIGRQRLVALSSITEAMANLALSLWLVRRYGLAGVAIGTAVPVVVANVGVLMPAACRALGIGINTFLLQVLGPSVVALAAAVPVGVAMRLAVPPRSLAEVIVQGGVMGVVYLAALWRVGLSQNDRERYTAFGRTLAAARRARMAAA
jgi:O-antigen/teichoic acid export membrane protein